MNLDTQAEGQLYGHAKPPNPTDVIAGFRPNFSGYPIPPDSRQKLHDTHDFYVNGAGYAGEKNQAKTPEEAERRRELGLPISGDQTARWHAWQAQGKGFPTMGDIPEPVWASKPRGTLF